MFYKEVLELDVRKGVTLVAYDGDLAIVVVEAKINRLLKTISTIAANMVKHKCEEMRIKMTPKKSEEVILAGGRKLNFLEIEINRKPNYEQPK